MGWQDGAALDLLAFDAAHACVRGRENSLRVRLQKWGNVEGLMSANIDWFLVDRQRRADRLGTAVFDNVRGAARLGLDEGFLMTNAALGATPHADDVLAVRAPPAATRSTRSALLELLASDDGWPTLARRLVRCDQKVQMTLRTHMERALPAGLTFVLGDLVEAVKPEARHAWRDYLEPEADDATARIQDASIAPVSRVIDARRIHAALLEEVERHGDERAQAVLHEWIESLESGDEIPTINELSRRLGWARSTAHDAVVRLRGWGRTLFPDEGASEPLPDERRPATTAKGEQR